MAVYQRLLLSTGGGIISTQQQANQEGNTATILIGLGGTGVHSIRTIKTQVYNRLKPDDVNATIPEYSHIQFLGVDTADKSQGGSLSENKDQPKENANAVLPLDDTEFFSIGNSAVSSIFNNEIAFKGKAEFAWLENEKIDPTTMSTAGAGGTRQVGRFMMMDKSQQFMNTLQNKISIAKQGLETPKVNIHIFSGLGGGTGSGCFLDVCYMVRSVAKTMGGDATIFGYFFLPDVNLAQIPLTNNNVRTYIQKNGYAAMQELDYCMRLPQNGGSFSQIYKDHKVIDWNKPPVDMCHLICATDENNNVIKNAYNYAMNVTAEYILDFLTESNGPFGLSEHLSNFDRIIKEADGKKNFGAKMAYCVIGASCACIPIREVNTYLASELFDKFSRINTNMPTKGDVEKLAMTSLAQGSDTVLDIQRLYTSLLDEISKDVGTDFNRFPDDYKSILDFGTADFVQHYKNQEASKKNRIEVNAKSMMTKENAGSLLARINSRLEEIMCDIERGPIYAYRMIAASQSHNLLNIIDGLITENDSRNSQEKYQYQFRMSEYENAQQDFLNRVKANLFDSDAKRFQAYEDRMYFLMQHFIQVDLYDQLDKVLRELRKQIEERTASYYIKLNRVMQNLLDTFKANKEALASADVLKTNSFEIPMMSIDELKPTLNEGIQTINIPNMLDGFMRLMIKSEESWIQEDENKITKLVTGFFVETAFAGFAGRTITEFLRDKYQNKNGGVITDEQLRNYIYEDWMKLLTEKARPLFYFDGSVWQSSSTSKLAFLSFPALSAPIKSAADKIKDKVGGQLKESALTDRIFVMCSACGLPLTAYKNCEEYERLFFATKEPGRHYYEGKEIPGIDFTDWNKLPSITPSSLINTSNIPIDLKNIIEGAQSLFEEARRMSLIDDEGTIWEYEKSSIENVHAECERVNTEIQSVSTVKDIQLLENGLNDIRNAKERMNKVKSRDYIVSDGYRETKEDAIKIQKDYFVASPAIQKRIEEKVRELKSLFEKVDALEQEINNKISGIKDSGNLMRDYCDAIFSGAISIEGQVIVYHNDGIDTVFSKRGEGFEYSSIPLYQGFLSYQTTSKDIRKEISNISNNRFNAISSELTEAGAKLKEMITDERLSGWKQLAMNYENSSQIVEFISALGKDFKRHCLEFGI